MLRLGTKYLIDHLRQDAIRRLKQRFPPRLADFRNLYASNEDSFTSKHPLGNEAIELGDIQTAIAVVCLGRSMDVPSILPPAFYLCAQLVYPIDGYTDKNGTHWELARDDLRVCLHGELKLRKACVSQTKFALCATCSPNCKEQVECVSKMKDSAPKFWSGLHKEAEALAEADWITEIGLCSICEAHFVSLHMAHREKVWRDLAKHFQLTAVIEWPIEDVPESESESGSDTDMDTSDPDSD